MSPRPPISLRLRLALIFAAGSLGTLLIASSFLYWSFQREINERNIRLLDGKVREVADILVHHPGDEAALEEEVIGDAPSATESQLLIRVLREHRPDLETPGMAQRLPRAWFQGQAKTKHERRRYLLRAEKVGAQSLQGALDITEDERMIFGFRRRLAYTLLFGAAACSFFGWGAAHRGLKPLRAIADSTSGITPQRLQERLEPGRAPQELRELVQALNEMLDRLDHAFERLSRFSADLAHELRTPINNLMGEAEVALSKDRPAEEYRQVLESSMEEFRRLSRLISRMLFLARAEGPHAALAKAPLEASRLVSDVLAFFEAAAEEQGVRLTGQGAGTIQGDSESLRQALANLISNALEATPKGGEILVEAGEREGMAALSVTDTGRGIEPEELPRILDRFYRTKAALEQKHPGTGLGLAIVQSIARLHGGELSISSEPGKGTIARLTFPL